MSSQSNPKDRVSEKEEIEFEAAVISRRFSEKVGQILPENEVAQAMSLATASTHTEDEEQLWWTLMRVGEQGTMLPHLSEDLKIATKKLTAAWRELQDGLPNNEKGSLKRSRFEWPRMYKHGKESDEAEENDSKMTKVKKTYQSLCETLDLYSDAFKLIPTSNEYVQIITGVLTTIVKATVNHGKIGLGFHKTIEVIGTEMEFCASTLFKLRRSSEEVIQERKIIIADVFLRIFNFLIPYAKWCKSGFHRFSKAMDKNYYDLAVTGPRDDILAKTGQLQRHTALEAAHGVAKIDQRLKDLEICIREGMSEKWSKRQQKSTEITVAEEIRKAVLLIGQYANNHTQYMAEVKLLKDSQDRLRKDPRSSLHDENLWTTALKSVNPAIVSEEDSDCTRQVLLWEEVELASRHIEVTVDTGYPVDLISTSEDMKVSPHILHHIQDWLSGSESQVMWLCGPENWGGISQVSTAAAYVVTVCEHLNLPLIAYRFRADEFGLPEPEHFGSTAVKHLRSIQMNRLVLMIHSIIRQLVWLLPESIMIKSPIDLSFDRFYDLDASTPSLLDGLNLVEELIELLPPKKHLICILDGFELVDNDMDDGTAPYLEEFLTIIRKADGGKVRKVLLSSDGLCRTLLNEDIVSIQEQLHVSGDTEENRAVGDEFWKTVGEEEL